MSIFNTILEKLGLRKKDPVAEKQPSLGSAGAGTAPRTTTERQKDDRLPGQFAPRAISEVDVVKKLEQLAAGKKGLDWKVSIVDLLKLLDIDSSFEARKEMAVELGCPAGLMGDSAKMNVWLHKEVLKRIAANGGNIPANLLD
jgi:hypothetical protein